MEYVPVKVVHNQYYDDHFDIEDEQFLLGKTLYYLAKEIPDLDKTLANSLQLLGLGMYNKFKLVDEKLSQWGSDLDSTMVCGMPLYPVLIYNLAIFEENIEVTLWACRQLPQKLLS